MSHTHTHDRLDELSKQLEDLKRHTGLILANHDAALNDLKDTLDQWTEAQAKWVTETDERIRQLEAEAHSSTCPVCENSTRGDVASAPRPSGSELGAADAAAGEGELIKACRVAEQEMCAATFVKGVDRSSLNYAIDLCRKALTLADGKER